MKKSEFGNMMCALIVIIVCIVIVIVAVEQSAGIPNGNTIEKEVYLETKKDLGSTNDSEIMDNVLKVKELIRQELKINNEISDDFIVYVELADRCVSAYYYCKVNTDNYYRIQILEPEILDDAIENGQLDIGFKCNKFGGGEEKAYIKAFKS